MNSKERLTGLFENREIDRVPIWLLEPFHNVPCYPDIYQLPSYKKVISYRDKYCDIFDRRVYDTGFCYNANPQITSKRFNLAEKGVKTEYTTISYKNKDFVSYVRRSDSGSETKYFVEDAKQLEEILEIPFVEPVFDFSQYDREKEELGNRGLMMPDLGDQLYPLYHLMSAQNFSLMTALDYEIMLEFVDEMFKRVYGIYKQFLENDIGEVFFIVGSEFAGPPMVSPEKFNSLAGVYLRKITDMIRSYGKKSIIHYHGQLIKVLEEIKQINPDALHTVESPPTGDCTITQAREVLGNTILIGNIQYDDLTRCSKDEIERQVEDVIRQGKSGRFILSPTAGPYEKEITSKTAENYIAMIKSGIKHGSYLI